MSPHRSLVPWILVILCVLPAFADPGDKFGIRRAGARAVGQPIHNEILDLLDEELFLDSGETPSWTSSPFKTSQFNRVILKIAGEAENGFFRCHTEWQFTRDDEFEAFGATTNVIGDDVSLRISPGVNSSLVYGMRARVRCDLRTGPDFGSSEPPPPATGSLTDVKVLLRRE